MKEHARLRLLLWASLASLLFGIIEFGELLERSLGIARNAARERPASGSTVLVAIDDRSLEQLGPWPWPRQRLADLTDRLREQGSRSVFLDLDLSTPANPSEDRRLGEALGRMGGNATLSVRFVIDPVTGQRTDKFPAPALRRHANLASVNVPFTPEGATWEAPYALRYGAKDYPSFAAAIAGREGETGSLFPIDYAVDPRSIQVISASDVLGGKAPAEALRGRTAVISPTSVQLGQTYLMPGHGRMPGIYVQLLGAETLAAGRPLQLGWLLPLLLAIAAAAFALTLSRLRYSLLVAGGGAAALLVVPLLLEAKGIYIEVMPSLFLLLTVGAAHSWQSFRRSYRERDKVNAVSGLPNLNALREQAAVGGILIVARVQNYPEICAALPADEEAALVEQIAARMTVGAMAPRLYHGDEGIFAWLEPEDGEAQLEEHLEALHAFFRSPIVVGGTRLDLAITFGVEASADRSPANRLGGALVAADEAAADGLRWKRYDPSALQDAPWKLSLLSQLDAAIEAGDLWVAYQPKFDVASGEMAGAEALVRWTHPEKGPISPMEFIPAAEQNGRIEKLTEFVLDRAIRAAAMINRRGLDFSMSVNLSPKLLGRFPLEATVVDLLTQHGLGADRLTLEVTETAALANGAAELSPLYGLRDRGVRISIDDYGTGLSTLDYIKRIPATEIKVDKSFVQGIGKSNSDKLMVNSTIQLAHSLGHRVVAEGVEDLQTLDALRAMGCDVVQGFYLAKPMSFKELLRLLSPGRAADAA